MNVAYYTVDSLPSTHLYADTMPCCRMYNGLLYAMPQSVYNSTRI